MTDEELKEKCIEDIRDFFEDFEVTEWIEVPVLEDFIIKHDLIKYDTEVCDNPIKSNRVPYRGALHIPFTMFASSEKEFYEYAKKDIKRYLSKIKFQIDYEDYIKNKISDVIKHYIILLKTYQIRALYDEKIDLSKTIKFLETLDPFEVDLDEYKKTRKKITLDESGVFWVQHAVHGYDPHSFDNPYRSPSKKVQFCPLIGSNLGYLIDFLEAYNDNLMKK
jgi:hypothetical protein